MGMIRTLPAVLATSAGPTPVYTGTPIASVSAVVAHGIRRFGVRRIARTAIAAAGRARALRSQYLQTLKDLS